MQSFVMRALRLTAGLLAAGLSGTALAGAGDLRTVVTPLQNPITYSAPATAKAPALSVVVAYTVGVANAGGNTINNIRLNARSVSPASAAAAVFLSSDGGNCTATANAPQSVDCSVGQLKAGQSAPSFTLFFASPLCLAPADCARDPATDPGKDPLNLVVTTWYAEGLGGLETSVPQNSSYQQTVPVGLGTANPSLVRSAVRRNTSALLFTGDTVPTAADPLTTSVGVPGADFFSRAEIAEDVITPTVDNPCANGTALTRCVDSRITILDASGATAVFWPNVLTITLRLDNSAVAPLSTGGGNKKPSVDQLRVQYENVDVGPCIVVGTQPIPNGDGTPCIVSRKQYGKSRNGKDFPIELEDDYEWILINIRNGSYKIL